MFVIKTEWQQLLRFFDALALTAELLRAAVF